MSDFVRFPHTPHLSWLGSGTPRDDKLLAPDEVEDLLSGILRVEEKVDGANLGLSVDEEGRLRVQNRGGYLDAAMAHPQFRTLWSWLAPREAGLIEALGEGFVLFGEWCYARHSILYDQLPDWFLGFDLWDRGEESFLDSSYRDELLRSVGLLPVPYLAEGRFTLEELVQLTTHESAVAHGPREGVVLRREEGGKTSGRGKLVRAEFTQQIEEHWSRRGVVRNHLAIEGIKPGSPTF